MSAVSKLIDKKDLDDDRPAARMMVGILETMIDELTRMSASWKQLKKRQQDEVISRLRARLLELTGEACDTIAAAGNIRVRVHVESMTVKKETKAVIDILEGRRDLLECIRRNAILVFTEPDQFGEGLGDVEGEDDQAELALDAAPDEPVPAMGLAWRLRELAGIEIAADHELWSSISPGDLTRVLDYVMALERGETDVNVPGVLGPFLPPDDAEPEDPAEPTKD